MTYDETWDDVPSRRLPLAAVAAVLAAASFATAMFVFFRQTHVQGTERSAREAAVGKLQERLAALEANNASLKGRLGSAEKTLRRRETGIAPLAKRVLRSVFTVETADGLGAGQDRLLGQDGNDLLNTRDGVQGNDLANGGAGTDTCRTDLEDRRISC